MRRRALYALLAVAAGLPSAAALAADLSITKSAAVVSDVLGLLKPRIFPGSIVDFSLVVANPLANGGKAVAGVEITDTIDPATELSLADYGAAGSGPVEFTDGGLIGLLASNLSYTYNASNLSYSTDGVNFGYTPVPVGGYDPKIRAIKVRLQNNFRTLGSFRLRYRTRVR